jgi:hypothetical protein
MTATALLSPPAKEEEWQWIPRIRSAFTSASALSKGQFYNPCLRMNCRHFLRKRTALDYV